MCVHCLCHRCCWALQEGSSVEDIGCDDGEGKGDNFGIEE